MAGGPYRSEARQPAVRVIFKPRLEPWRFTTLVVLVIFLLATFPAVVWSKLWQPWATVLLVFVVFGLQSAARRYEVLVEREELRLRRRHWPLVWRETRWLKTAVAHVLVEMHPYKSTRHLHLELRDGTSLDVLEGQSPDRAVAELMRETIERALDPLEIEALAEERAARA